ncbi:cytochrome c maturation protein CcmE [Candidatus Endowatersipora endosymbiont of Watersipora subatra]|uniref:cytochrome c maturation protein CcmE n=1 Tax=Candidatus Endowatersipora endosymbiont of Watersipora subatra TaxID=3077946 RepID=UPI00312CBFFB
MTRKKYRLFWILGVGIVIFTAVGLTLFALRDGLSYAMSISEFKERNIPVGDRIRLLGLVKKGSVQKLEGIKVSFVLTDLRNSISVLFNDILPDLFRENQLIIIEGHLNEKGVFLAEMVLAKHDENYSPKEFSDLRKEVWKLK